MGDAILCTPALRALRKRFESDKIYFFANETIRKVLSPSDFNDHWLNEQHKNPLAVAKLFRQYNFSHAILFKNSFASALAAFLAKIPVRAGYCREARSLLLTEKLYPPKTNIAKFKPMGMVNYYLTLVSWLGADTTDHSTELTVATKDSDHLGKKLPGLASRTGPLVILVPGGAFGASKFWLPERFAETADRLIEKHKATVIISVADNKREIRIAEQICDLSKNKLINLGQTPLTLGELKSLFAIADVVISNDTGPRHIAIALKRKVITLFGPNNPDWTDTGYENEIQIVADVHCAPCDKPKCNQPQHLCMESITTEMVLDAAEKMLREKKREKSVTRQKFIEVSAEFFVDQDYHDGLQNRGLNSINAVFNFSGGENLA